MLYRMENSYGTISLDRTLVNQIIQNAMSQYSGRIWQANYKGSQSDAAIALGSISSLAETRLTVTDQGIKLTIYVIIKFGESINSICRSVVQNIADDLKALLNADIDDIEMIVTAVLSKRASPREIVFTYRNRDTGAINMLEAEEAVKED